MRPCTGVAPVSETDPTRACEYYGISNNRAYLWEVHLLITTTLVINGILAYSTATRRTSGGGVEPLFMA